MNQPSRSGRVLLVGSMGFFGAATKTALAQVVGPDLFVSTRSAPSRADAVHFDLMNPATFQALESFTCVVNCAAARGAPPDQAIEFCRGAGITFIETTADPVIVERLLNTASSAAVSPGVVVLGLGLFPGLTNILAADALESRPGATSIAVGVRISPMSGAGGAMRDLMMGYLSGAGAHFRRGERVAVESQPMTRFPFSSGSHSAVPLALPEVAMLHSRHPAADVQAYLSLSPSVATSGVNLWTRLNQRQSARLLDLPARAALHLLRGVALRNRDAPAEISASCSDGSATSLTMVRTDHAIEAGAWIVAAGVDRVRTRDFPAGLRLPEEVFSISELIADLGRLNAPVTLTLSRR